MRQKFWHRVATVIWYNIRSHWTLTGGDAGEDQNRQKNRPKVIWNQIQWCWICGWSGCHNTLRLFIMIFFYELVAPMFIRLFRSKTIVSLGRWSNFAYTLKTFTMPWNSIYLRINKPFKCNIMESKASHHKLAHTRTHNEWTHQLRAESGIVGKQTQTDNRK